MQLHGDRSCFVVADYAGIGFALVDLAHIYQGQHVQRTPDSRLPLSLLTLQGGNLLPAGPASGMHTPLQALPQVCTTPVMPQHSIPPDLTHHPNKL